MREHTFSTRESKFNRKKFFPIFLDHPNMYCICIYVYVQQLRPVPCDVMFCQRQAFSTRKKQIGLPFLESQVR